MDISLETQAEHLSEVKPRAYLVSGERTRIRAFGRRDADRWLDWPDHPDPLYAPYNPVRMAGPLRDAWFADLVHRQGQLPFVIDDLSGAMIGRIFLRYVNRLQGASVLGIDCDPRYVGQGYGTDALRAFLGYYFGELGFNQLALSVAAYNERARRSYERCGFVYRGTHWERLRIGVDVLGDSRYEDLWPLFRRGRKGLEAIFHTMVVEKLLSPSEAATARESAPCCLSPLEPRP